MARGILTGIRIIDLTQALAGPYCTQLLADFGAEVVKIERPGSGDQSRGWGPPFIKDESAYFLGTNRNKRSLAIDLSKNEARPILQRLLKGSDILIHNVPKHSSRVRLGIDAESCMRINPALIWASISGFGTTGPEAEKPGYDVLAQGMSGTMALTGAPDSGPTRFPTPMADITSALYATIGILGALYERKESGAGQRLDIALLDSQATWLANVASSYLATGTPQKKRGNAHPNIAPYQPFKASDGWLIIAVGTEVQWSRFLEVIPRGSELAAQNKFSTNADRVANREALEAEINQRLASEGVARWLELFQEAGIPCGPILTPEAALEHPQLLARDMVVRMGHPTAGDVRTLGNPIKLSRTPTVEPVAAPMLGQHTKAILQELGFSKAETDTLISEGTVQG